jgi:hypothetical protein
MAQEKYLGDGLYASMDHGMIKLRAPQAVGDQVVFLEPETFDCLMHFARDDAGWLKSWSYKEGTA